MATTNLDPNTSNNDVGLYITESGPLTLDVDLDQLATYVKCTTAGTIRWFNKFTGKTGDWYLEAGEGWPIAYTKILSAGTTAGGLFWATSGGNMGNQEL
jgi:hypothetical protein